MPHLPIKTKPISGKPVCYESGNDCIVGKDIFVMMGGVVENFKGMVHEGTLGVHVDEACGGEWG